MRLQVVLQAIDKATAPLRGIDRRSKEAAQALRGTLDELKQLKQQQAAIGQMRELQTGLRASAERLRAMRQRVAELRSAHIADAEAAKAHAKELRAAEKAVDAGSKAYERQLQVAAALKARLANLGIKSLAADEARLASAIQSANLRADGQRAAVDRLGIAWKRAKDARRQYESGLARAGQVGAAGVATAATGYAVAQPAGAAARAFLPQEDAAMALRTSMMDQAGQVSEDFERIKALATDLGNRLPGTTAEFLQMMTMLRRQGISAESVLGGLGEASAYLAVQLRMPKDEAAAFAAKMQDATQTAAGDMMGLLDQIQRAYNVGVDPTNMLAGITKVAPAMTVLRKQGLEATKDLLPLLVMMDQAGMAGEAAGNALRKVFQASVDAGKREKANDALAGTGIKLDLTDGQGEFGGMDKLFQQLQQLRRLTSEQRGGVIKALFGDDAETLQVVNTLMAKGAAGMAETTAKMQQQADLRRRVNEQLATLGNTMEAALGSLENTLAEIGAAMAPSLITIVQWLGEAAAAVGAFAREHPTLTAVVGYTVAGLGALLSVVGMLLVGLAGVMGPLGVIRLGFAAAMPVLEVLGVALGAVAAAVGLPVWAIGALVVAFAAAAAAVVTYWEPIKAFFIDLWAGIKKVFWNGVDSLLGPLRLLRGALNLVGFKVPEIPRFGEGGVAMDERAPLPAGAGQQRPVVVQGAHMPVTINAAPGTDAKDIAREFERLQAKLQRDEAARARSALTDRD